MSDLTETIPDVEFPYPPCPLCDEDLDHDDGWYCQHCEVSWHENGTSGERYGDPPVPPSVGAIITDGLPSPCSGPLLRVSYGNHWWMQCRKCDVEHIVSPYHHRWTVLGTPEHALTSATDPSPRSIR